MPCLTELFAQSHFLSGSVLLPDKLMRFPTGIRVPSYYPCEEWKFYHPIFIDRGMKDEELPA